MANNIKAKQMEKRQQEDAALNRILIWFAAAVVAEIILLLLNRFIPGVPVIHGLTILVPIVAVLAMIFYLFQHDFFCITVISAGGILSLQLYRKIFAYHPTMIRCGYVLAFLLLVAAAAALVLIQRGKRPMPLNVDRLVPQDSNFLLLYVTCALNAAALALTLILGSAAAYYLLFLLVAWLFVTAVYYIVKLM